MFRQRFVLDLRVDDKRDYRFECPPIEGEVPAAFDEMCMLADRMKEYFTKTKEDYLKSLEPKADLPEVVKEPEKESHD